MLEYENITVNAIIQPILNNDLKEIRRHIKKATCKKIETDVRPAEVAAANVRPARNIPRLLSKLLFFINSKNMIGQ
tara:strand:- start:286 stop:513 length:228 start_codon:yes stop_codon:yes gene_type:complete